MWGRVGSGARSLKSGCRPQCRGYDTTSHIRYNLPQTHLAVTDDQVLWRAEAEGVVPAQRRVAPRVKQAHILARKAVGGEEGVLVR